MAVEFVGIDPNTDRDHCPTVWADAEAQEILLQGWKPSPETQAECEASSPANGPVVSEPVSEYIRWEHYVTHANVTAGEEVRWLPRRRATSIPLPGNDFWLFDGALLRVHHFSGDGVVVEDEITAAPDAVKLYSAAFEAVWERAIPHHLYEI